jgi:hypothetical protein
MDTPDLHAADAFLRTAYEPDDWIAVLVKSHAARVAQRIVPVSFAMTSTFQEWLTREHAQHGAHVFVSVNAFSPRLVSRSRTAVTAIRHVFLDADRESDAILAAVSLRDDLPELSYVVHSSSGRAHILWRVTGFTLADVEALQKFLARTLNTDRAATSGAQMTRLPGYWNRKRLPASLVTVDYGNVHRRYAPQDFPPSVVERPSVPASAHSQCGMSASVTERTRRYVAASPAAIAGHHGDVQTFQLCCRLVRGFALSDEDALTVLHEWNARCQPPWSLRELTAKLQHARCYGCEPIGALLETQT